MCIPPQGQEALADEMGGRPSKPVLEANLPVMESWGETVVALLW